MSSTSGARVAAMLLARCGGGESSRAGKIGHRGVVAYIEHRLREHVESCEIDNGSVGFHPCRV